MGEVGGIGAREILGDTLEAWVSRYALQCETILTHDEVLFGNEHLARGLSVVGLLDELDVGEDS